MMFILKIITGLFIIAFIIAIIGYPAAQSHFDPRNRADRLPPEPYPSYSYAEGPIWITSSGTIYSIHDNIEPSINVKAKSKSSSRTTSAQSAASSAKRKHPKGHGTQSISPLPPPDTPLQRGPFYDTIRKQSVEYEPYDPSSDSSGHYVQRTLYHLFDMIPFNNVRPGSKNLQLSELAKDLDLLLRWVHASMVEVDNNSYELAWRYHDALNSLDDLLLAVEGLVRTRKQVFDLHTLSVLIREVSTSDRKGNGWDEIEYPVYALHNATSAFIGNCTAVLSEIGASEIQQLITREATGSRAGQKEREAMTPEFKQNLRLNRPLNPSDEDMGGRYAENLREIKAEFARNAKGAPERKQRRFDIFNFLRDSQNSVTSLEHAKKEIQNKITRNRCMVSFVARVFLRLENLARELEHGKRYLSNTASWIQDKVTEDKRTGIEAMVDRLTVLPILVAWKEMLEREEAARESDIEGLGVGITQHVERCTGEWVRLHPEE